MDWHDGLRDFVDGVVPGVNHGIAIEDTSDPERWISFGLDGSESFGFSTSIAPQGKLADLGIPASDEFPGVWECEASTPDDLLDALIEIVETQFGDGVDLRVAVPEPMEMPQVHLDFDDPDFVIRADRVD